MALQDWIYNGTWLSGSQLCTVLGVFLLLVIAASILYRLSPLHPFWHVPGPLAARLTNLGLLYHSYKGDEGTYIHKLHQRYGPTVLVGPNSVDFTDIAALHPIYVQKGGFPKADYYRNFDIDGHASIFSNTDSASRAARVKVVLPLFSAANIRKASHCFADSIRRYINLFQAQKELGEANVLDLARGMSIDAVTEYLFSICYGALHDQAKVEKPAFSRSGGEPKMSASAIVDNFIATGRFFYLPPWLYGWADWVEGIVFPNPTLAVSTEIVNEYIERVISAAEFKIEQATDKSALTNYPCRLLLAGFSRSETAAQCKDIIYAATDTIGMNLATLCFMLAKHPEAYDKLHAEVISATVSKNEDLQQLPFLNGVVRESLRLSLTNPSRIPREVPAGGWRFQDRFYPPGAVVSASTMDMHFSEECYESPHEFRPERWTNASDEMHRSMMAFGLGGRQCIARTMSMFDMHLATYELVKADILRGATPTADSIEIEEGFAAKVVGGNIELVWTR
jgi:cytochrome P450